MRAVEPGASTTSRFPDASTVIDPTLRKRASAAGPSAQVAEFGRPTKFVGRLEPSSGQRRISLPCATYRKVPLRSTARQVALLPRKAFRVVTAPAGVVR